MFQGVVTIGWVGTINIYFITALKVCKNNDILHIKSYDTHEILSLVSQIDLKRDISPKHMCRSLAFGAGHIDVHSKLHSPNPFVSRDLAIFNFCEYGLQQSLDR